MNLSNGDPRPAPAERPNVWRHRDARRFLGDYCAWLAVQPGGFSFRALSRNAGIVSPNYVQQFIRGRRNLKPDTAARIAKALGLGGREASFFQRLVAFTQAGSAEMRRVQLDGLLRQAVRDGGVGKVEAAHVRYFEHWFIPVVHAMASLADFQPDPAWICRRITPSIRRDQAATALAILAELGILEIVDGRCTVHSPRLEAAPAVRGVTVREYHRATLQLAIRSLDDCPTEERSTNAITITVPQAHLPALLTEMSALRRELFERLLAHQHDLDHIDGEVVQILLHAFPATKKEGSP